MDTSQQSKFVARYKNAVAQSLEPVAPAEPVAKTDYDVVIVGAGLAGLVVADELRRKAPALDWCIVEATDRIGGKRHEAREIHSNAADGLPLWGEPGGRWVSAEHTHIVQLCRDLRIQLGSLDSAGDPAAARDWDIDRGAWAALARWEVQRFLAYIDELAGDYGMNRRQQADGRTMESVICWRLWCESSRQLVRLLVRFVSGCAPQDIAFDEWMMLCHSTDGMVNQLKW